MQTQNLAVCLWIALGKNFKLMRRILKTIKNFLIKKRTDHKKIFSEIYKNKVWGDDNISEFYSGTGSDEENSEPYVNLITSFIKKNNITSVIDLGCGDFRVGRKIADNNLEITYTGVDIVDELIERNANNFGNNRISFQKINIVKNNLPVGQLCLIRQVLQHLSNNDIKQILKKCRQFQFVIISEHQPLSKNIIPNIDKDSDAHIRLNSNSGVFLEKPPFNKQIENLLTIYPQAEAESQIVTFQLLN